VRQDGDNSSTPFDDGVYDTSESSLRRQVRWLRSRTRILCEAELLDILHTGRFPKVPCSLITFDDGYKDNYTRALPILQEERATAIFFIATALTTERRLGWWDLLAWIVKRSRRGALEWQTESISLDNSTTAIRRLQRIMKSRPAAETATLVDEMARQGEVELPDLAAQDCELMDWNEIRGLLDNGMDIGAHTHTHRVLACLSAEEQAAEIRQSKQILESALGRIVRSLAYPVGGSSAFSEDTARLASSLGIEIAFSYSPCANRWTNLNRYDICRLPVPDGVPRLAAATVFPRTFAG